MLQPALTLVCLPAGTPVETSTADAEAVLAEISLDSLGATAHFLTRPRRRGLFGRTPQTVTTGGPIEALDLEAMRAAAFDRYWRRWWVWYELVGQLQPAQPYWTFLERHLAAPDTYPLRRAAEDYRAQPQVLRMRINNAWPHRKADLPTNHLEAFHTDPQSYAQLGWLSAVPGDRLLYPDGTSLAADNEQLSVRLDYLGQANQRLSALDTSDVLVALRTR